MEKIVKTFYEKLEEGKIVGRKCSCCGNVEFPPVFICNKCGSFETEWIEISGKATFKSVMVANGQTAQPHMAEYMPYALGAVTLEEGSEVNALIQGITKENAGKYRENLPAPCHAKIVQRDGFKTVIFEAEPLDGSEE